MTEIVLPVRRPGRQSESARLDHERQVEAFCGALLQFASTVDFRMSSRGWCYFLEPYGLRKGHFDKAQGLINECRKSGLLPLDFTAADSAREFENIEVINDNSPEEEASETISYIENAHHHYRPISLWDNQPCFVQMLVEKIDLRGLFGPICAEYNVPIANARGWSDINSRATLMKCFAKWERQGKRCVLLYCGDYDPGGLIISDRLRSNMADLTGAVGWSPTNLVITRFGLNLDFIEDHRLSWIDNLETGSGKRLDDHRHPDHRKSYVQDYLKRIGAKKVEANAMVAHQDAARELCRNAILEFVDEDAVQAYLETLAERQEQVRIEIRQLIESGALDADSSW